MGFFQFGTHGALAAGLDVECAAIVIAGFYTLAVDPAGLAGEMIEKMIISYLIYSFSRN